MTSQIILLLVSIAILPIGPLVAERVERYEKPMRWLYRLITMAMAFLVLYYIIPESIALTGYWAIAMLFLGLIVPTIGEILLRDIAEKVHRVPVIIGALGLGVHALLDGAALTLPSKSLTFAGVSPFAFAVLAHKIPAGFIIWSMLKPGYGRHFASVAIALEGVGTIAGFVLGEQLFTHYEGLMAMGLLQAVVAGSIIHSVIEPWIMHGTHEHKH